MYWEYIGTGLGVLAIGVALTVGVPPPWWPEMPRGFVRATIAVGILFGIIGLYLLMTGLSPAFKDQTKWPQIGMIIFAVGFIGCALWYWNGAAPMPPQTILSNSKESIVLPQLQIRPNQIIDLSKYSPKTCFDYSTNDGLVKLALNAITFEIRFSKASDKAIHVYKDSTNLRALANLKGVNPGDDVDFAAFDSSSRVYTVPLGGYFIAQNVEGYFLLARVLSIKDDTRGDANDEVCFAYRIDSAKGGRFKAI
jgi:hypothetical protein